MTTQVRTPRGLRTLALASSLTACLAACGSTVQVSSTAAPGELGSRLETGGAGTSSTAGTSTRNEGSLGGSGDAGRATGATGVTGRGGTGGGGSSVGSSGGGTATSGAPRSDGANGAGVTKKNPVEVGIMYIEDLSQFGAAFSASGAELGDTKIMAEAVVDHLNARGGMDGHKIVPRFYGLRVSSSESYAQQFQAACDNWTQDHKVAAALLYANNEPAAQACLNKRKTAILQDGLYYHDDTDFQQWPYMVDPVQPSLDRLFRAYADGLVAQGFLTKQDTIGLVIVDTPEAKRARPRSLDPALARHGLKISQSFEIGQPRSSSQIGDSISQIQAAQLKFASSGVNKVLFLCNGCVNFFMRNAESQGYRPQYGLTTADQLFSLAGSEFRNQLKGARAIGWSPYIDQLLEEVKPNATAKTCLDIVRPTGQANSQTNQQFALQQCDMLLAMTAAVSAADDVETVTGDDVISGFHRLGSSYASPLVQARFSATQRDAVSAVAPLGYVDSCSCFRYSGPFRPLP